jgi:hypothetical protein
MCDHIPPKFRLTGETAGPDAEAAGIILGKSDVPQSCWLAPEFIWDEFGDVFEKMFILLLRFP